MFVFFTHLWKFRKISIFLASSGSFTVKNDNYIFTVLNLPASLQNKNTQVGLFPWKWSVLQNPARDRTNQSAGICHITNTHIYHKDIKEITKFFQWKFHIQWNYNFSISIIICCWINEQKISQFNFQFFQFYYFLHYLQRGNNLI